MCHGTTASSSRVMKVVTVVLVRSTKWCANCLDKTDQLIDLYNKAKNSFKESYYLVFTGTVALSRYHNFFTMGYNVSTQCGTESEGLST